MNSKSPRGSQISDRFDEALQAWAGRPPRTPPEEAARRIAERLPERGARLPRPGIRPAVRLAVALAAAVFVLAVGLALFVGPLGPRRGGQPGLGRPPAGATPPAGVPVAPAGDVLVLELDPETTLYMTLRARG